MSPLAFAVVCSLLLASKPERAAAARPKPVEVRVDEKKVQQKVDARLKQVLVSLRESTQQRNGR